MNEGIWYDPVSTMAEPNIAKSNKTAMIQAETFLEPEVDQEWATENHMVTKFLMGEN